MSHSESHRGRTNHAVACELRRVIARRQVTLTALSTATGIRRTTLYRRLRGEGDLTVAELVRLAVALEVPAADLIATAVTVASSDRPGRRTSTGGEG